MGRVIPVSITLKNLLEKNFAEEYAARRAEEGPAPSPADNAPLPLFVMACILPGASSEVCECSLRWKPADRRTMHELRTPHRFFPAVGS